MRIKDHILKQSKFLSKPWEGNFGGHADFCGFLSFFFFLTTSTNKPV